MFFKKKMFGLLTTLLIMVAPTSVSASPIQQSELELAKQSVENYIQAISNKDSEELIKWVDDKRFSSTQEQKNQYEALFKGDDFSSYEILDLNKDGDTYVVTLKLNRNNGNESNTLNLPVVKNDNIWKLVVDGKETISTKVKQGIQNEVINTKNNLANENKTTHNDIMPLSSSVAYWDFSFTKNDGHPYTVVNAYSSSSFNMSGSSVTINGWQELLGSTTSINLKYQIVKKGFFSDDVYGETYVNGRYPKNGNWFSTSISTSKAESGVHIKVHNPSSTSGPNGAGNAYQ
ncbi:hypothetical protein [Paenibacillus sp. TC-CSREp1]|uniref:hypothetical protein n=1 Tax=Paenibacillus sp. TC-CSREp1 TaxID=3410089 RepID=UPI003CFB5B35